MAGPANTQFSVAAHVLIYLADQPGRPVSSDELAGSVNVSPVHIRRVLGPLRTAGLVVSRPGAGGGWELGRSPDEIRLDEVWDLAHVGPTIANHGPDPRCPVGEYVDGVLGAIERDVSSAIHRSLRERSIGDIAAGAARSLPTR